MNREDIIALAREADWEMPVDWNDRNDTDGFLMRLALTFALHLLESKIRADEREPIRQILKGIDKTEYEDPDGWWETSVGASFGGNILAAILERFEK